MGEKRKNRKKKEGGAIGMERADVGKVHNQSIGKGRVEIWKKSKPKDGRECKTQGILRNEVQGIPDMEA